MKRVIDALVRVPEKFKENELAYLSLTSKNESIIRNAFCIDYFHQGKILAREYNRIDAVYFEEDNVKEMYEFTSMYTKDIADKAKFNKNSKSYFSKILRDLDKNAKYRTENTDEYIILISTHPKQKIKNEYRHFVKYMGDLNKATDKWMKNNNDFTEMIAEAHNTLREYFPDYQYYMDHCVIKAGKAFDCEVEIYFWILCRKN